MTTTPNQPTPSPSPAPTPAPTPTPTPTKNHFDLTGRVSLVTGATKGLGRAIAQGLAEAGSDVVIVSRKQDLCDAVASEISESTGRRALPVACHVGEWEALPTLVDRVYDEFGKVDVLFNNAGINPAMTPLTEMSEVYFDKLCSVNLKGPIRLAALLAPRMGEHGGGSIINVATLGAYSAGPGVGTYTGLKAALLNFTKTMAAEWVSLGVRVNALSPGPFLTEMMKGTAKYDSGFIDRSAEATLMKRVASPEEIVGIALYLASDASSYVTGEDYSVAGGMRSN